MSDIYAVITRKRRTFAYGDAFEHFIVLECTRLSSYLNPEYRFSYLKTKDDAEIDLIVDRLGKPHLFIEIKSTTLKVQFVSVKKRMTHVGD